MLVFVVFAVCALAPAMAENLMIGFNRVTCPAKSDTLVSVPFMKHPVKASGSLASAPNLSTAGQAILSLASSGNWTTNEFKGKSYVRFTSGAKAGHWYDILANTNSTLTIDLNGETGSALASGDTFMVVEYWTLNTLFPPGNQTTIHVSSGNLGYQQKSKILFPNITDTGINLPAEGVYFLTSSGWKQSIKEFPIAGDKILPPGLPFIIRHPAGVVSTFFEPQGRVLRSTDSLTLTQAQGSRQDNTVAVYRPVDVPLSNSGLDEVAFTSSASHELGARKDELLVFDNSVLGFNKKPSAIYYKVSGSWFREDGKGAANPAVDQEKALSASGGLVVRKASGTTAIATWKNQPTY
jgi:uncharacterized protein (TIGR02597 family)